MADDNFGSIANNPFLQSFFFTSGPGVNMKLREKIALAQMMQKQARPRNFGEGLSAIGEALGVYVDPVEPLRPEDAPGVLLEPQTADIALPADRERLEHAARELLTSDGWRRWIRVRATSGLSRYSVITLEDQLEALEALRADFRARLASAARERAAAGYAVDVVWRRIDALYAELLGR